MLLSFIYVVGVEVGLVYLLEFLAAIMRNAFCSLVSSSLVAFSVSRMR